MKRHAIPQLFIGCLTMLILMLFACSKDFEELIQDDFDFSFTGEHSEDNYVFEPSRTTFSIIPEKEITTVDYFLKYSSPKNKGVFLTMDGDTIFAQDTVSLSIKNWSYNYVALDTGAHDIKFKVWDSNARAKELNLLFNTNYAGFSFGLNKGLNAFIVNSKNPISLTLLREKETKSANSTDDFELSYTIENGTGSLSMDGREYALGQPFRLPKGTSELDYLPETLGEHTLLVTAIAPDGAKTTQELSIIVTNLNFTINATAASTQVELDTNLAITIDLATQQEESNVSYEITHSFSSDSEGAGTVRNQNGGVMEPGQYRSIEPGSYGYTFNGTSTLGQRKLYFEVRDSNGQIKRDSVQIEVANIPFSFTGDSENNVQFINRPTYLNFNLESQGNTSNIDYVIRYELLEGNGRLTDSNGTNLVNSTGYPVAIGNFSFTYIPESIGSHRLAFIVTDNYGQEVGPVEIDLESLQNDFELSVTPTRTSEFVNAPIDLIVAIDERPEDSNATYEAFYTSGRNGTVVLNGISYEPGEKFQLTPPSSTLRYTGTETGQHDIVLSVASNANVNRSANVTLNYEQLDFLFTASSQETSLSVGELTNLNFTISETTGSSNFTLYYTISGNALIRDSNGSVVNAGTEISIGQGNFDWTLEGTNEGRIRLAFYAKNDTGLEKTVNLNIEVSPKDYNFIVNAVETEAYTGETVPLNFNITELGVGGDFYTLYFSNGNNNGSFEYGGVTYAPGESFTVPTGQFQGVYSGLSEATHNLTFIVRSSSGVEKNQTTAITFTEYQEQFDLTTSQPAVDIYQDRPFPFSVVINAPDGHDPEVTYNLTFSFSGVNAGFMEYDGILYREGETIPINHGSTRLNFTPLTDASFTIDFSVENTTGISRQASENVSVLRKPKIAAKGEKRNINCGGFNGCDYEILLYTCFETNCSEAYDGASLQQVEIRIYNRAENRWDTLLFNYNDALGNDVNRFFRLEEEPSEGRLKYLDQDYQIRVMDTNGQWSDTFNGRIIRV